jgi:hypothetical protein
MAMRALRKSIDWSVNGSSVDPDENFIFPSENTPFLRYNL